MILKHLRTIGFIAPQTDLDDGLYNAAVESIEVFADEGVVRGRIRLGIRFGDIDDRFWLHYDMENPRDGRRFKDDLNRLGLDEEDFTINRSDGISAYIEPITDRIFKLRLFNGKPVLTNLPSIEALDTTPLVEVKTVEAEIDQQTALILDEELSEPVAGPYDLPDDDEDEWREDEEYEDDEDDFDEDLDEDEEDSDRNEKQDARLEKYGGYPHRLTPREVERVLAMIKEIKQDESMDSTEHDPNLLARAFKIEALGEEELEEAILEKLLGVEKD